MKESLQNTLTRFAQELLKHGFRYALIGGLASSIRGRARATEDIDLILLCDVTEALALVASLHQTGFVPLIDNYEEVVKSALLLPLLNERSNIQLDLAIGLSGFEREVVERADPIFIGHSEIFVATAEDLLIMKVMADRPQDQQDVNGIIAVQAGQLDWNYCIETATQLQDAVSVDLVSRIEALRPK